MRIQEKNIRIQKRTIVVSITVIFILILIGFAGFYYLRPTHNETVPDSKHTNTKTGNTDLNPPTKTETITGQTIKKNSIDTGEVKNTSSAPLTVNLQGIQKGNQVVFDTLIQAVSNNGQCSLSITSNSQIIVKTSDIFANPDTSSCKGFSILTSELPAGTWNATLTVTIGSQSGTSKASVTVGT